MGMICLLPHPLALEKPVSFLPLVLAAWELCKVSSLIIGRGQIPGDPVMILICPTKALEADMVWIPSWRSHGIYTDSFVVGSSDAEIQLNINCA